MRNLLKFLPHKEIGWKEYGETFYRYTLAKTPWFNIYLHELDAPNWHPDCHDHPWWFLTILLRNGYYEKVGDRYYVRNTGTIWYHPAEYSHSITTPFGTSWSLVITGKKSRKWGFRVCHD